MNRLAILLLWIGALASLAAAASAPTFCKCTCFSNSTIIEIKSKSTSGTSSHLKDEGGDSSSPTSPTNEDQGEETTPSTTPSTSPAPSSPSSDDTDNGATTIDDGITQSDDITPLSDLPESPENLFHTRTRRAGRRAQTTSPSCSQCNRAFCLSQSLPICKGATEKDVVTMCFQRDSRKDQIVVWGFILGTAGLLGWAALRKAMEMQETGMFIGAGSAFLSRATAGRLGREGRGGRGLGGHAGMGLGRSGSGGDDWRGQYAGVATHSRQNSVAPLMGAGNYSRQNSVAPLMEED